MAAGHRPSSLFIGRQANNSLVRSLHTLIPSSSEGETLQRLEHEAIAELDNAINGSSVTSEESSSISSEHVSSTTEPLLNEDTTVDSSQPVPHFDKQAKTSIQSNAIDFSNPFIRSTEYLEKRQSAITNPVYREEYEEYRPLRRLNKSKSVNDQPNAQRENFTNYLEEKRRKRPISIQTIISTNNETRQVTLLTKSKNSKKELKKQDRIFSDVSSNSDDSALGGSITKEELTKGLVTPFVEVDRSGETYCVYPAITVPQPGPEEKEPVDPFHRFKKKRKKLSAQLSTDMAENGADNRGYSNDGEESSDSGRAGITDREQGKVKNRASYLDAVGRMASVDENPKSGDVMGAFRPRSGYDIDDDDMHVVCNSDDEESVKMMTDTDEMLEASPTTKQALEERSKNWDVFRELPHESGYESRELFFASARKVFKVVTYVFLLLAVLGMAAISKGTLLLVSSNLRHSSDFMLQCVDYTENEKKFSKCVELPINVKPQPPSGLRPCLGAEDMARNITRVSEPYTRGMCDVMIVQWVWCLILIICTPYMFTFLRCLWSVCFKHKKAPTGRVMGIVILVETVHVVGMAMFTFRVLPLLNNVVQGLMLMCGMGLFPSILKVLNRPLASSARFSVLHIVLDCFALLGQISALIVWPIITTMQGGWDKDLAWSIPVSLVMISVRYWENYIDEHTRLGKLKPVLLRLAKKIRRSRTKIQLLSSIWKVACIILLMMAFLSMEGITVREMFNFNEGDCTNETISYTQIPSLRLDWVYIWIVNFGAAFVCYFCARSAIKIQMQRFSFAIPLTLSSPVLLGLLIGGCEAWTDNPCTFVNGAVPGHMFYKCWGRDGLSDAARNEQWWLLVVWWLSQFWLTWHIWIPQLPRLVNTDKIFVQPLYDGVALEQSLMYNLTRNVKKQRTARQSIANLAYPGMQMPSFDDADCMETEESHPEKLMRMKDETPLIYICATMWHENETEMIMLLKSIGRLDIDQCARRNAQDHLGVIDPDYYEFESHIFFDDAMDGRMADDMEYTVNPFVKQLVKVIDIGISAVHESDIKIPDPVKYPTPYGGRLEWTLPGGNKLIAHIKDKMKIRHKKRWSQVMYMYYFLGFKLWGEELSFKRKELRADNTYLLALDGDVDFQPLALQLLVDLMKRNDKVGAACGRIHPIGSGPMVWYQKFEYALGHWLQKATEHVLGCVLCSPGCFSLFRGSVLMDDNVMKKYTTLPTEASHYVQYDQGEDRWLCTLILQQGYRVEYCAASDSYTFAPEGFNEFYNQRRRWMPSTMANVLDLLLSWRHTIKLNDNISFLYIIYQTVTFVFSLLGPGTIFLMIVGALTVALNHAIGLWTSFFINLLPILIFIILCYTTKPDTQLWFASILTAIYALIQMLVLVGIIIQIAGQGPCSPTAIFFFYVAGTFIFSAILHPQEFFCVLHGFIYFLAIPSMYLLLMIYSLCNLNVVSWGTREVKQTKTEKAEEENLKLLEQENIKSKKSDKSEMLTGILNMIKGQKKEVGTLCRWGACCSCLCCPKEVEEKEDLKFNAIFNKLELMESNMTEMKQEVDEITGKEPRYKTSVTSMDAYRPRGLSFNDQVNIIPDQIAEIEKKPWRNELVNPFWMEDEDLGYGPHGRISQKETNFFQDLITKYLYPLDKDKATEERVAMELADLKNKMSFAFLLGNGMFVVVMFTLQMNTSTLAIPWPCGTNLRIEPLGFFFLCFFALIMILQTIGMITHRMTTFLHICATTTLTWGQKPDRQGDEVQNAIELAKNMARIKQDDDAESVASTTVTDGDDGDDGIPIRKRTKTVKKIQRAKTLRDREPDINRSMDQAFTRRMEKLAHQLDYEGNTAEEIEKKVLGRKNSTGIARRKSVSAIKFLQSRRDRDPRARGYSNASSTAYKPEFLTTRSLEEVGVSEKAVLAPTFSLDAGGGTAGRKDATRMSIVREAGENEDVASPDRKPPVPLKPALKKKKPIELDNVKIEDDSLKIDNTENESPL